ncbi:type II secretion system minor pseudopilin GspH [Shewanella insulae]|uniref:Type II secretion system protein H n=1 Tax=Shewanella insulae TaxID=2681496 RepID=A0A6L7HZ17_9GAMM|nr:type II secretion system minor pseudopilin GspH [Shewanella insulae]MCG9712608.1 type II secretion system minor pseudopilin GspH [Shewanella insulae]MCG9738899.1 type II secretion system minor pseudopilin GspH [Shewanella insulae]MCG9754582.1 type II secretion system minor pseudopilin GspH [Shewanella insulae]MXR69545.1 type II secretion system minor pseudopilin GspH [Shewanella insulae]
MRGVRQFGFTLLEVLLVVLLMGLAAAAVTYTTSGADQHKALERTARQFIAATELVLDETILSGHFIGIVIDDRHYEFVFYDEGKWKPLQQDRLLAAKEMEPGVEMDLVLDGLPLTQEDEEDESWFDEPLIERSEDEKKKFPEPQVLLFPSGEMSAFELTFIGKDEAGQEIQVLVVGDALGRLTLGREDGFDD